MTVNGESYEYPLPAYAYKGGYPQCNQHGFFYEVEAVHRCLAQGLRELPQHTRADSLQVLGTTHLRSLSMATEILNWLIFTYDFEIGSAQLCDGAGIIDAVRAQAGGSVHS
eukprot:SAG25_NODE_1304_length_3350_cov_3.050446_2_plen_111_part_00